MGNKCYFDMSNKCSNNAILSNSDIKNTLKNNLSINTFRNFDSSTNLISFASPRQPLSKSSDFSLP